MRAGLFAAEDSGVDRGRDGATRHDDSRGELHIALQELHLGVAVDQGADHPGDERDVLILLVVRSGGLENSPDELPPRVIGALDHVAAPRAQPPFFDRGAESPVFRHGNTYSGHATNAALALKNLEILEREDLVARAAELERHLAALLDGIASHELVAETRVGGLLGGVELMDSVSAEAVTDRVIELGFITRPLFGNTIQISPPFVSTDRELTDLVGAIREVLDEQETAAPATRDRLGARRDPASDPVAASAGSR